MKPWLKKLDELKAKAADKKNTLTAHRFRENSTVARHYKEAIERGETHAEATLGAVKKAGISFSGVDIHLRGWFLGLSLDESSDDLKWRWRVSVSQSTQIGSGPADQGELREMIERLGGKFEEPCLTPQCHGTKATHWRWDFEPP